MVQSSQQIIKDNDSLFTHPDYLKTKNELNQILTKTSEPQFIHDDSPFGDQILQISELYKKK